MSSTAEDDLVILEPQSTHTHTAIMLHGRGSTGEEFSSDIFETRFSSGETLRDLLPGYRWVFPSAAVRHSMVFREDMSQWYDIYSLTDPEAQSESQLDGVRESVAQLKEVIAKEAALSPNCNVVLGGISQGFTIALLTVLSGQPDVSALVGFSSWLPFHSVVEKGIAAEESNPKHGGNVRQAVSEALSTIVQTPTGTVDPCKPLPVFIGHCVDDNVVDIELGRTMKEVLVRLDHQVSWRESPNGGHWINEPHGMNGLKSFLWTNNLVSPKRVAE